MKKLIYLTSILVLSACVSPAPQVIIQQLPTPNTPNIPNNPGTQQPGNNNNQNPGNGTQDPGNTPLTPEQQKIKEIKESNEKITGLLSIKDSDGKDIKLDTIEFNYIYSFELDKDGKISGIKDNRPKDSILYKREGDSNSFKNNGRSFYFKPSESNIQLLKNIVYAKYITSDTLEKLKEELKKVVNEKHASDPRKEDTLAQIEKLTLESNEIKELHHNDTKEFNMYGKEVGLKYSDFGYLKGNYEIKHNNNVIYDSKYKDIIFFGYQQKEIKKSDIQENTLTFKGKAVGVVKNYKYVKNDKDYIHDYDPQKSETLASLDLVDNNATLTFNKENEKETLNMSFSNWYDVKVEKDKNSYEKFTFTNPNNNTIDEKLKFDENTPKSGDLRTRYYGDDKTKPSEVVGSIYYRENDYNAEIVKELKASFGGVKQ